MPNVPTDSLGTGLTSLGSKTSALLYGPEGTGKTTAALRMTALCKADQRVLLVDAEGGAKPEALVQRGVDIDRVEVWPPSGNPAEITFSSLEELAENLALPANRTKYVGTVWDSGTEITRRILDDVTATAREKDARLGKNRGRFQVNLEDYGVASSMLRDLLRKFRDLPMHFAVTALERRDIDQDSGRVKYGPAMSPSMANDTAGLLDVVGYTIVEEVGQSMVRSAHFTPTAMRRAKDRYGVLPGKLADPFFDRIVEYVSGDLTRESDPIQARVRELAHALVADATNSTKEEAA